MSLVVITGGARSGKSRAAQDLARSRHAEGRPVVVAVFASESDAEMTERIARHRADRPEGFTVIEAHGTAAWVGEVPEVALLVIDCLGTWLGRAMLEAWGETAEPGAGLTEAAELPDGLERSFASRVTSLVDAIVRRAGDTLVVTNEVGSGVVPAYASGRLFRDELGRANAALCACADASYVAIAGRLIDLGSAPREISWPTD